MTIQREAGIINFVCDECPETLDTETSDFDEALHMLKSAKWTTYKVGAAFHHRCPTCLENRSPW